MKVLYCAIGFSKKTKEQRMKTFLSEQHATNRNKDIEIIIIIIWPAQRAGKMNQILRLATRAGKMELSCSLRTIRRVP